MCFCILHFIFVAVNVLLVILGLAIAAAGIAIIALLNNPELEEIRTAGITIIIVGGIISGIFFCGCCGAVSRNNCLLIRYSIIITIFSIASIVTTVLYSNNMSNVKEFVVNETAADIDTVQILEPFLKCCGTTGPDSYEGVIPITCCPNFDLNSLDPSQIEGNMNDLDKLTCNKLEAYERGCIEAVGDFIDFILDIILNVLICVDVAQVIMLLIAISLICEKNKYRRKGLA